MKISPDIPLTKLLDLMLDAICVVDEQDKFVFASAACERVFCYSTEEIIGKTVFDLVHPEDRQRTLQTAREIMSGNAKNHFENRYVRKDGNIVHIMWSAQWSENHKLRIAVARDITERKSAELVRQAVYDIAEAANTAEDFPSLFQLIHRIISGLMTANNFCVALYDAPTEFLSFPYFVDERHPSPLPGKLDSKTRIAEVIRTGKPLLFSTEDPDPLSWLGVPATVRLPSGSSTSQAQPLPKIPAAVELNRSLKFSKLPKLLSILPAREPPGFPPPSGERTFQNRLWL